MIFSGRVQFRSSSGPRAGTGPPGEKAIQRLNPNRERRIRAATGWDSLAPGSLNLAVDDSVLQELARHVPTIEEAADDIVYPNEYVYIPRRRVAYWYYSARVERAGVHESVLVRRAKVPVSGVVELFSVVSLTSRFGLATNDALTVEVLAPCGSSDVSHG